MSPLCTAILFGLFVCSRAAHVSAHDFWLQPREYWITPDALTPMTLQVGHGPFRQRSPITPRRITRFQAIAPMGAVIDMHEQLTLGQAEEDGEFRFKAPGAYVLVLQTDDRAQTHLPSIRFNDYLKVEGLTPALQQRARLKQMDRDGSERYSRCAKSLIQIGPANAGPQGQVNKPVGLPLEIVPEANPYGAQRLAHLPIRVLYENRPLAGALVKLTNLNDDATPLELHLTDQQGRASFTMPTSGAWLLNVIWTKALPASDEADFDTVFSSLSFGFRPG